MESNKSGLITGVIIGGMSMLTVEMAGQSAIDEKAHLRIQKECPDSILEKLTGENAIPALWNDQERGDQYILVPSKGEKGENWVLLGYRGFNLKKFRSLAPMTLDEVKEILKGRKNAPPKENVTDGIQRSFAPRRDMSSRGAVGGFVRV